MKNSLPYRGTLTALLLALFAWHCASGPALAETLQGETVAQFDRWMYPYNVTPGSRSIAPTFSAVGSPDFDNMDGQFILGFQTTEIDTGEGNEIVSGKLPAQYNILSVRVELSHFFGSFSYDPTQDDYRTYLETDDPNYVADSDTGRPIELYGVRYRAPFEYGEFSPATPADAGFAENDSYKTSGATEARVRNAFAFAFDAPDYDSQDLETGDVSNYVTDEFTPTPFAVGQSTSGLNPGDAVPQGTGGVSPGETFGFDVNLANPQILSYLQQGLADGGLFFAATSLHPTEELSGGQNPNFYTSNNFDPAALPPTLILEVEILPDPGDMNGDGSIDSFDVQPMVLALTNRQLFETTYPDVPADFVGDLDGSGSLNLGDLGLFKTLVSTSGSASSNSGAGPLSEVPEPSTLGLWLIAILTTGCLKRRATRQRGLGLNDALPSGWQPLQENHSDG